MCVWNFPLLVYSRLRDVCLKVYAACLWQAYDSVYSCLAYMSRVV